MNPESAPPPPDSAPHAADTDLPDAESSSVGRRQIQALRELIDLSKTCNRTDRRLQDDLERRTAWAQRRFDLTTRRFLERYDRRRREQTRQAQRSREQLQQNLGQQRDKLERDITRLRGQLTSGQRDARGRAQKEMDHDRWVAESMLEGRLAELRGDREQDSKRLEEMQEAAAEYDRRARADLRSMRHGNLELASHQPPDPPKEPHPDPDANSAAGLDDPGTDAVAEVARLVAEYPSQRQALADGFQRLHGLLLPMLFLGPIPYALWLIGTIAGAVAALYAAPRLGWTWSPVLVGGIGLVVGGFVTWLVGRLLFSVVSKKVRDGLETFEEARRVHHDYLRRLRRAVADKFDRRARHATAQRDAADRAVQEKFRPLLDEHADQARVSSEQLEERYRDKSDKLESKTQRLTEEAEGRIAEAQQSLEQRRRRRMDVAERRRDRDLDAARRTHADALAELQERWDRGRDRVLHSLGEIRELEQTSNRPWDDPSWEDWQPPTRAAPAVRFGSLHLDVGDLVDPAADGGRFDLSLPASLDIPALLSGPDRRSLLVTADAEHRAQGLRLITSAAMRLLTTLPPGRAKFTLIDPVGLGESFGGLMHLADHEDSLVSGRVWSEPAHIDRRLLDLTDHMGQMIQKYLRNDFASIDAYNAQAGELAEPYRFLVVADYPRGFSAEAAARLNSIAASGARSGAFVLVLHDPAAKLPAGEIDDLARHCAVVSHGEDGWRWRHPVTERFTFTPDTPPGEGLTTRLLGKIGRAALDAGRVQVPFATIAPDAEQCWSRRSAEDLNVPIGRAGASRLQAFRIGHGVAQHALVAGKTGSGKSSLMHTLVANLCLWYSPDQLELYLIDFKKGVEFKPYVNQRPPHLRAIAIESDREFGVSILRHLDAMLDRRGEMFRDAGVANLAGYHRARPDTPLPRVMLIVDEFQELFSQDDTISQQATSLLDRLVRQGRAFGVHAFLGSQSLSGAAGLPRGTFGQMGVRIALQCSENDSQLILGDDNSAARLLTRPGEAIYNDQGGSLEANSLFQVAWLPDHELRGQLDSVQQLARERGVQPEPCYVFEGNTPAALEANQPLNRLFDQGPPADPPAVPQAYLGEPIAIDQPVSVPLARLGGANVLVLGQDGEATLGLMQSSLLSLAAAFPVDAAQFVVFNGFTEPEHDQALRESVAALPHAAEVVAFRDVEMKLAELHAELQSRIDDAGSGRGGPTTFVYFYALQRFRQLRGSEAEFSFSLDDDAPTASAKPDQQLQDLLRDGPGQGLHLVVGCDRAASLEQVFDRRALREFDFRVMFQMSATDSAQLIDSSAANDLGPNRALLYREDRGTVARFRPYGMPSPHDLSRLNRTSGGQPSARSVTSGGGER